MGRKKKGNVNSRGYYTFKKTISTKFDGTPIKKVFYSKKSKADAQRKAEEYIVKQQLSIQLGETLNPVSVNFKNCAYMWLESVKSSISDVTYNTYFCPMCTGFNNAKNRDKSKSTSEPSTLTAKKAGSDEISNPAEDSTSGGITSEQEAPASQEEQTTESDFLAAASSVDYDLKITDWEISADYDNKPALIVYYEYTNKKDTPTAFMWEFTDKVYQNGIELSSTAFGVKEENNNNSKEIQQGVTATVSIAYILQDTENPVDITVEEYNIWTKGDYIINKTLDIKK